MKLVREGRCGKLFGAKSFASFVGGTIIFRNKPSRGAPTASGQAAAQARAAAGQPAQPVVIGLNRAER